MKNSFKHIVGKIKTIFNNIINIYKKNKDSIFFSLLAVYLIAPCAIIYKVIEESDINMVLQFLFIIVGFICFWLLFMICRALLFILFIVGWIISMIYIYHNMSIGLFIASLCLFVFISTILLYEHLESNKKEE